MFVEAAREQAPSPHKHGGYERLLAACKALAPVRMAVVHPCSMEALEAALEARDNALIVPVLVGPEARMRALAIQGGLDLAGIEIVATEHSHASAAAAVALARNGRVAALMKGVLHTAELLHAGLATQTGMRQALP